MSSPPKSNDGQQRIIDSKSENICAEFWPKFVIRFLTYDSAKSNPRVQKSDIGQDASPSEKTSQFSSQPRIVQEIKNKEQERYNAVKFGCN